MIRKRSSRLHSDERRLLLIGLGGLLAVMLAFIVAIAIVSRLEPTTGPGVDDDEDATSYEMIEMVTARL